ncbi:MAG: Mn2+ and Fe2+ transporter of the family, partial [Chthonomonadales bacterium]|nr:Mn2+ and Fe2+ transporter of the family [Chthonomonadales bacterium]
GIYGYSLAGAQYGSAMLWVLVLVTISLAVCQEMGARMGVVTGKGLADLIREEYGVKTTFFAMGVLLLANFATTVSEFAGITAAVQIFAPNVSHWLAVHLFAHIVGHPPEIMLSPEWAQMAARWIVVPLTAGGIWLLVTRSNYKRVEKFLLYASVIYLAYIVSAFKAHPHWGDVLHQTLLPNTKGVVIDRLYLLAVINIIGTTITPWGQFYIQSSVRDKGDRIEDYAHRRIDVLFGAFFTNLIAFFIIVCCGATLFRVGMHSADLKAMADRFGDAGQIAIALKPVAGNLAAVLFAIGLFNASCFGAITVPLSTAYAVSESLGSESGVGLRAREAPMFVGVFTLLIFSSAFAVLLVNDKYLSFLITLPNIVGAALLPIILILSLRLVNNPRIMGKYTNSRTLNVIAWITTGVLVTLSVVLFIYNLMPGK